MNGSAATPPRRVLHLLRIVHADGGGVQSYLASVAQALSDTEIRLLVAGLAPGKAPAYPCELRHMGRTGRGRAGLLWDFWRMLRVEVPACDVVHIHNVFGPVLVLGALACRMAGRPYVVSPHGRLVAAAQREMDWRHRLYLHRLALPLLRRARALAVMTPSDQQDLKHLDARLNPVVIPPGVNATLPPVPPVPAGDGLRIVFVGRLVPVKNLPLLLEAAGALLAQGMAVQLDVLGWSFGNYQSELEQQAEALGLGSALRLHGAVRGEAKDALIRSAHVLALPSFRENFSFVTAEALSLGVPVLISDRVGLAPLIRRYDCGRVLPCDDAQAWAAGLQAFMTQPAQGRMAANALRCARENFSLSAMRDALERLYRSLSSAGAHE